MDYIVVCLAALVVSALTLFSGFGLGTLLMPVFAIFFPVHIAIAATAGPLAILMTSPAALIEGKYRFLGHDELLYSCLYSNLLLIRRNHDNH